MPFGRAQLFLFLVFLWFIQLWQAPLWSPPVLLFFLAITTLAGIRPFPEKLWGWVMVAAIAGITWMLIPTTRFHPAMAALNLLAIYFLWQRSHVSDYLLCFILGTVILFLLLVSNPAAIQSGLFLAPLFLPVYVLSIFFLILRHDMETHYIVKHRLGRQSRRVEVGRLLMSRRVLDTPLVGLLLSTALLTTLFGLVAGYLAAPALGRFQRETGSDFPQTLDIGRLGRPVLSHSPQLEIRGPAKILPRFSYWRGQVYDRLENGIWYRARPEATPMRKLPCTEFHVRHMNPHLKDGYAPLVPVSGVSSDKFQLTLDHRVFPGNTAAYTVCVAPPESIIPDGTRSPPLADVHLPAFLHAWADTVVSAGDSMETTVRRIQEFLQHFRYDEAYPRVPAGRDAVFHFLFFARKGPCGVFSTLAVALLSHAGIPSRLVTGFSGGTLSENVLRFTDADAHAWVEAWHPRQGWITLDPTREARQELRALPLTNPDRFHLGLIILGAIPLFLVFLWVVSRMPSLKNLPADNHPQKISDATRKISQTSMEAQLLFARLATGQDFASLPRFPGEAAMRYAERLQSSLHPRAAEVRNAAELAGRILFAKIDEEEKKHLLEQLRDLCPAPINRNEQDG